MSVTIRTECAHCQRPMEIRIDSDLNCRVPETDCNPIVFIPDVDLFGLEDESIVGAF